MTGPAPRHNHRAWRTKDVGHPGTWPIGRFWPTAGVQSFVIFEAAKPLLAFLPRAQLAFCLRVSAFQIWKSQRNIKT
jgi:hypothetical protein